MNKVLVIAGPTASGKTAFSVEMAKLFGCDIISGDSVQVYRGLDIGSGKVTEEEKQGVVHHLIDIRDPREPYSAADFQKMARELIEQKPFSIIAGGTGLYLKSCLYDYSFRSEESRVPADPAFEAMDDESLYELLKQQDPVQAEKIHPHNRRRVMRSLTILKRSGMRQSDIEKQQKHEMIYDVFIAGCTMDRKILYERISRRVDGMFEQGLVREVEGLIDSGCTFDDPGMQGIGYREFRAYFNKEADLDQVREEIKKNSRHYAKRQYTWLNHQMPVHWFDVTDENERRRITDEIREWREKV
ncbi:MAG: tRNA (adenosine(37)-N6)-dimethylallyltransferase MiaA [Solobacterium sp.]|nr:tRNA (adenosine(37)-N6)-dimethylallyltransferase MiaA [Solobacterium sp.]